MHTNISGFPRRAPTPGVGRQPIDWPNLCRKLHENERNWTKKGGARPLAFLKHNG